MEIKDLLKSAEGLAVIVGCLVTFFFGKLFALITGGIYILLNIPSAYSKTKELWHNSKAKELLSNLKEFIKW